MKLTATEKIKIIMDRQRVSMTELAARTGQTRQNLTNKMSRGNLTEKDICKIADGLRCNADIVFTTSDGEAI